jgi:RNA polymerase sigma-70 factor, ECF subfamily
MPTHLLNEPELVSAAQSGDQNAFGTLVTSYYRPVFRLAVGIMRNREDAEDVVQDAMMKAFRNLRRFQGKSRFYTWVVRITINEALMKIRVRQRDKEVPLDEPTPDGGMVPREIEDWSNYPEKFYAGQEAAKILDEALQGLSPRLSTAFRLRNVEELCLKETAATLGISTQGAKSRVSRAKSRLRKRLRHILCNYGNHFHR